MIATSPACPPDAAGGVSRRRAVLGRAWLDFRSRFDRLGLGVATVVTIIGPLLYWWNEGTKHASAQVGVWVLTGAAPIGVLVATAAVWSLVRAPVQVARDELVAANAKIAELTGVVEELTTRVNEHDNRLAISQLQLGHELREIIHRIEIVRGTRPHPHYSHEFALPTTRWDEYGDVLAGSLELFREVEPAYAAVAHVHAALEMRRTRANPGQTLGAIDEDGLDDAYRNAGAALDALGEERGPVWQNAVDREIAGVADDIVSDAPSDLQLMLSAKYAQALLSAYRDIIHTGEELLAELRAGIEQGRGPADLRQRGERWVGRSLAWANDSNSPLSAEQRQAFLFVPLAPPPNYAVLLNAIATNLDALRAVDELIEP
jgi:hypothetical protein